MRDHSKTYITKGPANTCPEKPSQKISSLHEPYFYLINPFLPIKGLLNLKIRLKNENMRALIVIDMLNDFLDPKGVLYCGEAARKIIPEIKALLAEFRQKKEPVIYVCDAHDPEDKEFEAFPAHCVKGTWGAEVIPELAPQPEDRLITKTRFDAFFRTELEDVLRELGVTEVWLCGVCTSICVMDTAAGAFYRGFKVVVPEKAVGDFDPEAHIFALKRMERIYKAKVI